MISYVVPTMWFYPPFLGFLYDLIDCPYVSEVIVINNNREHTPQLSWLLNPKIKMYDPGRNIGVNPAWNFGVSYASNDKICIANDDILFDFKLFQKVMPFITPEHGIIGLSAGEEIHQQVPLTTGNIDIVHWPHQTSQTPSRFGFGCLFFINKRSWVNIPEDLMIYYGDDWIIETQIINQRRNFIINNCLHHGERAITCSRLSNVGGILARERDIYIQKLSEYRESVLASRTATNS